MADGSETAESRDDSDSPWKRMLDAYFAHVIALLNPALHAAIDWDAGVETLDSSLPRAGKRGRASNRYVDKLVRVQLRAGGVSCS